jgi:2-polyprenyl-6-methoxyphenol hydroxylase-like FAD-dependent oxidoreductase
VDTQVIVVGAGPVGLMLAGELRLGGARVTVLERLPAPTTESRASTLHARTMELLDERGLLAEVGTPPHEPAGHFGGIRLDFSGQETRFPGLWKVPQTRLEEILGRWAAGLGADIRRGYEVCGLTEVDGGVAVESIHCGQSRVLRAECVVGCDGEESAVRRLGGFELAGTGATRELLRADVLGLQIPDRRFQRFPNGLGIAATRNGISRVMVHDRTGTVGRRTAEPDFAEVVAAWAHVVGEDIGTGTPIWVNAFGNASRQATRYRMGRVLLAGDAAHQQMPVGGQALNLGVQDAANLGWKLAAEVTGRAPDGLLDSYHRERHPVGQRVLGNIAAQALVLLGGPEVDGLRAVLRELLTVPAVQRHLADMIGGLDVRYEPGEHPLVGARMPNVTALLRTGRGVLLDLSADPGRHARLADRHRVPLVSVEPAAGLDGLDAVLVRPDGYVAWAAGRDADTDPEEALHRWFGPVPASRR